MALLPVEEALERLLSDAAPIEAVEDVPLDEANGRVLARPLAATRTQPPFSASAMDGYAVRFGDVAALPADLTVVGQSAAGHGFAGSVGTGQTVRIFTGAPLPDGADTVVIQENVETLEERRIRVVEKAEHGSHIRVAGLDFREGDELLQTGGRLDAGRLMLAAAMNHARLPVRRRPVVAILATGDELVSPGKQPGPDQIIASNSYGIAAIVADAGGRPFDLGIAGDTLPALDEALRRAEDGDVEIIVTLGGASVGDHDLVQAALTARGMTLDFWKIAMRPGKPLMFGRLGGRRVLGLPGNPVSSLVCGHLFLAPLVRRLAGLPAVDPLRKAVLENDLGGNDHRQDYLRARLTRHPDGHLSARTFDRQDSSMMRTFALAEALVVRPPNAAAASAGDPCDVHVLREPAASA